MNKILLLFPNFLQYEVLKMNPHQPPLNLAYLSAMLEKNSIPHVVCDAAAENVDEKKLLEIIENYQPNFIGITTNIAIIYAAVISAKNIKAKFKNIKIIMGGPWAHANYELLLEADIADIVCFGEAEYTLVEILKTYTNNINVLSSVSGISYKFENKIIRTQAKPPITDLDEIPFPNWKMFPIKKYDAAHRYKPFVPIITSRGCPYDCINCTKIIHGYKPRLRSIQNIIEELEYLKKEINPNEIVIMDDIFNYDLERAKKLLREIIKRNFNFKFQLLNGIRADNIDLEFAYLLKASGTYKVAIGIESGSQKVISFLHKKLNLAILENSIKILHKAGLIVYGYFILGLPIETVNSMIYSIDFADRINLDMAYFFGVLLFPGSKLYDYIIEHKYKVTSLYKYRFINLQTSALTFEAPNFNKKDYERVRKYYIIRFYLNPRRFLRFLRVLSFNELLYLIKRAIGYIYSNILKYTQL